MPKEPEIIKRFDQCPVCKLRNELAEALERPELSIGDGKSFYVESLADEVKAKGYMRPEMEFHAQIIPMGVPIGIVRDPSPLYDSRIPIGGSAPTYRLFLDACMDCGCIVTRKLERGEAVKSKKIDLMLPGDNPGGLNRQQRRHPPGPFSLS